jgi:hypothetical protein
MAVRAPATMTTSVGNIPVLRSAQVSVEVLL